MSAPRVSIIIPTHDRPRLLDRAVASARAQAGVDVEVVVVDDGSEPPAAVAADVLLVRTPNRGASAARNEGLNRARGDHVMFLDSDDWLELDAAANLLAAIEDGGADMAFGSWRTVDDASGKSETVAPAAPYADALANAVAGGWMSGSFLMKRALAARFDPALVIWEVVAFECESLAAGGSAARCGSVVLNVVQHADPGRISNRHDHFEPLMTARAFAGMKAGLARRGLLNAERIAAFNGRLLPCLHALLRAGRPEAREVHDAIERDAGPWPDAARFASFAWCVRRAGLAGGRGFVALNRMLGR